MSARHKHEFTALYWHFGPYGDQTVHVHSCFEDKCDRVLVGQGRKCDGQPESHRRVTLWGDGEAIATPVAVPNPGVAAASSGEEAAERGTA